MRAKQHFDPMQLGHLFMVDGFQTQRIQPIHFLPVMHDVAKAIERTALTQFFFRLLNGGNHAEAETRFLVDGNHNGIDEWTIYDLQLGAEHPEHLFHLLLAGHVRVVDNHGVFRLTKRRLGTMCVAVIAVFYVC